MATFALNLAIGFAASYLANLLAPSSPSVNQEGPRLNDLSAPKSSYGAGIPRIYGSVRVAGNLIWASNIRETVTTTQSSSGGGGKGGGGGGGTTTTYTYNASFAVLLAEGQIGGIKRIWLNSKLVYNIAPDADLTVICYKGGEVKANHAFASGGLSEEKIDAIVDASCEMAE